MKNRNDATGVSVPFDDLPDTIPVNAKELAAIEMFLGAVIDALIAE